MPDRFSEQALVSALDIVKRAVGELDELDRLLEGETVTEDDRAPIASAVLSLYAEESWLRGQLQRLRVEGVPAAPSAPPPLPAGAPPPPAVALMRLFGPRSEASVQTAAAETVQLRLERASGERALASVAGPMPAGGSRLYGAATGVDGVCWRVELEWEAVPQEDGRTLLDLSVTGLVRGGDERQLPGGETFLEVVECAAIAPLSQVHGEVLGLSAAGFHFVTSAPLRPGDRLRFRRRYFAELVDGEVEVESVHPARPAGSLRVGCTFVELDAGSRAALARVGTRSSTSRNPVDYQDLLSLAQPVAEPPRRRLRRLFGRKPDSPDG
jgi:hypothetical protein